MAQEIVRLCDLCLSEDVRANAQPVTVALNGKPLLLDLCDEHGDQLIKPLATILAAYGQPVATAAPPVPKRAYTKRKSATPQATPDATPSAEPGDEPHPCPLCPTGYAGSSALLKHLQSEHGINGVYAVTGGTCPLCGLERPASGPHSMAGHVRDAHGQASVARALRSAGESGDPHGVLARVQAAAS
jgi:hypothetical protein